MTPAQSTTKAPMPRAATIRSMLLMRRSPVLAGSIEPAPHKGTPRGRATLQIAASASVKRVQRARHAGSAQSDEHDPRGDPSEARRDHQSPKQEVIVVFAEERRPAVHHADRTASSFVSLHGAGALTLFTHWRARPRQRHESPRASAARRRGADLVVVIDEEDRGGVCHAAMQRGDASAVPSPPVRAEFAAGYCTWE